MTTSYIREKLAELRKNKKLERAKEIAERAKTEAAKKAKEIASIERIAKKMARISGIKKIVEEFDNEMNREKCYGVQNFRDQVFLEKCRKNITKHGPKKGPNNPQTNRKMSPIFPS